MSWKTLRLGKIVVEDRQIVASDSTEAKTRPYLGLEQIESKTGRILSCDNKSVEGKSTTFAFDDSHVLYGKLRPYLNKVAVPTYKGRCSTEIIPLLPQGVNREFLAFLLRTDLVVNAAMSEKTGSRMPRADMDALFALEISVPETPSEQHQIVARLKAQLAEVETARQAAQVQARDVALLRSRLLKEMFATLDGTPCRVLGDHAPTTSGSTPPRGNKYYWEPAEIPWIKTGEVTFAPITQTEEAISKLALAECSLTLLPPKSVLVAMIGQGKTRGQSALLEIAATTNQNCFAILPNDTWEPEFLFYWFVASYQNLRNLSADRGGSQSALNGALLNALKVPAPDQTQQLTIVHCIKSALHEVDMLATSNKTTMNELELLPQRILAQAFDSQGNQS